MESAWDRAEQQARRRLEEQNKKFVLVGKPATGAAKTSTGSQN
jgi:hypothetical protein